MQTELNKMVLILEIFELVTFFEELIDFTMVQCHLYLQKKRRYSLCLQQRDFQRINYLMRIVKLSKLAEIRRIENLVKSMIFKS